VIRALLSDRLRRRDDIANALGAPVRSISAMRARRRFTRRGGGASSDQLQRTVGYLRDALPTSSRRVVALAVVPIGEPLIAARSVVALARSCAQDGSRVVLADLLAGAPAAKLLHADTPGLRAVSMDGAHLVAAVPDPADFAPIGPFRPAAPRAQSAIADELAAACSSADLLLTLIPLDPEIGGEHLASWAADAVVVVTAGESSSTKIHAVGEMIRLAGTRLVCALLVGADKTDESLGLIPGHGAARDAVAGRDTQADVERPPARGPGSRMTGESASTRRIDQPERVGHRRRTEG